MYCKYCNNLLFLYFEIDFKVFQKFLNKILWSGNIKYFVKNTIYEIVTLISDYIVPFVTADYWVNALTIDF